MGFGKRGGEEEGEGVEQWEGGGLFVIFCCMEGVNRLGGGERWMLYNLGFSDFG